MMRAPLATVALATGLAAQTVWPDLEQGRALLAEHDLAAPYDALRARLGQVAQLYRAGGSSPVTSAMLGDPLTAPKTAIAITDRLDAAARAETVDVFALLAECAFVAGLEAPPDDLGPDRAVVLLARSNTWDDRLDLAVELLTDARLELETAFASIPDEERIAARDATRALLDAFVTTVYPTNDDAHGRTWSTIRDIDRAALLRAACHLAPLALPEFWEPLKKVARRRRGVDAPAGVEGTVLDVRATPLGPILVGGFGANRYDLEAALIVDFAGNDHYAAAATCADVTHPVCVVVDLWGDDTYDAPDDGFLAQGAALFGVALLADHRGDDTYRAGRLAQGAGACGVGILLDTHGADAYDADALAQGAGCFGFGILVDTAGDDRMHAALYAQGFGGPVSAGVLVDVDGNDARRATGRYPSAYGTEGQFMAMSQGAGVGMRTLSADKQHVAGGFGILLDGGGDDRSEVGEFGFGMGYFLGTGIVRDRGGNDVVDASRYGIATGAHQAVGLVLDDAGDDRYHAPYTASIAGNWDHMVSILVDAAGDDTYQGAGITCGSSTITSFAALIDGGGRDHYDAGGSSLSLGTCGHATDVRNQTRCVALLLDLGGEPDVYERAGGDPPPSGGAVILRRKRDTHEGTEAETGVGIFADR